MNTRTASLLTALLFLAAPLAFVPSAIAQYPVTCVTSEPNVDQPCVVAGLPVACAMDGNAADCPEPVSTLAGLADEIVGEVSDVADSVITCVSSEFTDCPSGVPNPSSVGPDPVAGCIVGTPAGEDQVHGALCSVTGAIPTLPANDGVNGNPFTTAAYAGDDDTDGRADYFVYTFYEARDPATGEDGCGLYLGPDPTESGFDGLVPTVDGGAADCFGPGPVARITVRIDLNAGPDPVDGPLLIVENVFTGTVPGLTLADGNGLSTGFLALQDPRENPGFYQGVSDIDNDGDIDFDELGECNSNPTNPESTCTDPDADGSDTGRANAPVCGGGTVNTDADNWDHDGDGRRDNDDPCPLDATNGDSDGDGMDALAETACGTSDSSKDSDGDGIDDNVEASGDFTAPCDHNAAGTNAGSADTDSDGQSDGPSDPAGSVTKGPDPYPRDPSKKDTDLDTLLDSEESSGSKNLYCSAHPAGGASILKTAGCSPVSANEGATDPQDTDSDNDGLSDAEESNGAYLSHGPTARCNNPQRTDPNNADTDGDSYSDYAEDCGAVVDGNAKNPDSKPDAGALDSVGVPPVDDPCEGGGIPVVCPGEPGGGLPTVPSPAQLIFNSDDCHATDPEDPDCAGSLWSSTLDSRDRHDTDDNGVVAEYNNQIDLAEEHVFYFDLDERTSGDAAFTAEHNGDLEGDGGLTIAVLEPGTSLAGVAPEVFRLHVGDGGVSDDPLELFVLEEGPRQSPDAVTCLYVEDGQVHVAVQNHAQFNPAATTQPCGPGTPWDFANRQLADADPFFACCYADDTSDWLVVLDANEDGIPEGVVLTAPAGPCDPYLGLADPCAPGEPVPISGIPEVPTSPCDVDPVGLPVCGGELPLDPSALGPCDPTADGFPEGCDPAGELPVDPGMLCGQDADADAILTAMGLCASEPDHCDDGDMTNNAGCEACQGDLAGAEGCEPAADPCDPQANGFPEGCNPTGDLPLDPAMLCGIADQIDAVLVALGVPCETGPCGEDPMGEGCVPDVLGEVGPMCADEVSEFGDLCLEEDSDGGPVLGMIPGHPVPYTIRIDLGLFVLKL